MTEDNFLDDISSAVDNNGTVEVDVSNIVNDDSTDKPVVPENNTSKNDVEKDLSKLFGDEEEEVVTTEQNTTEQNTTEKKVEDKTTETNKSKQENQQQQQPTKKLKPFLDTFLKEDENGNLTDGRGEIIAPVGKARTFYEGLKKEGREQRKAATDLAIKNAQLSSKFKEMYDEFTEIKSKNSITPVQSIVKETGFSESEATSALELIKLYKSDPISAIKNMLTQAKINGIDISKIGANISADPSVIRSTLEQILDDRAKTESVENTPKMTEEAAIKEANSFLQQYPDANDYVENIAAAKEKYPQMSLEEIWLRLSRAMQERSEQNSQTNTMHPYKRAPVKQQQPPKKKVAVPQQDYANMSFAQIANSIIKENE